MARVLVLYHSTYGHIEAMAKAEAEGARSVPGVEVDLKRVPELVPDDVAASAGYKLDQQAPVASPDELANYDAIILGCGTRYGRMASQMANFLDQTGGLWARGALNGKVGAAFTSTATQHGGQETTLFSVITNLLHLGLVVVGLPYSFAGQMTLDEITGGAPYGATTITGGQGQRMPSELELEGARFQGRLVAETAARLHGAYTSDLTRGAPGTRGTGVGTAGRVSKPGIPPGGDDRLSSLDLRPALKDAEEWTLPEPESTSPRRG